MDIFTELAKSVETEDNLKTELFKVQRDQRNLVRSNIVKFMDAGVLKISVDKRAVDRMAGKPPRGWDKV